MKTQSNTRGGPNRGRGRKAADGATDLTRKQVKLDPSTISTLKALGEGNLSLGIRRAASGTPSPQTAPLDDTDIGQLVADLKSAIADNLPQQSVPKMGKTVDAAIRAVINKLEADYEVYAAERLKADRADIADQKKRLNELRGKAQEEFDNAIKLKVGAPAFMTKSEFKQVRAALHPDKHGNDPKMDKAFQIFNKLADKYFD